MLTRLLDKNNLKFHCNSFCTPQAIQFKELRHQLRSLAGISAQQIKLKHIHKLLVVFMKNHKCSNYALSESKTRKEDVQLESKNLKEFQYPTNLTPFYLHWKCSISENANTETGSLTEPFM